MKAAIIGCGYVGRQVAQCWRAAGLTVTATTTTRERVPELESVADRMVVLSGSDAAALQACLSDQQTVLVSVAAGRGGDYAETYLGTAQSLAAILPQTSVQQLIYTSTCSVYGQQHSALVTEATPINPTSENARLSAAAEQTLLQAARPNLKVCILRLGGIYGPGRELAKIFSRAAGATRPGNGQEPSNWVHLDDIVGAIEFAHTHQLQGIYNLVQDQIPTIRALIDTVCQQHQLAPITWDPTQLSARSYDARVSNQKLKAAGYRLVHPEFAF
jgi:nucleoside-diphosphate-sugar epimerase